MFVKGFFFLERTNFSSSFILARPSSSFSSSSSTPKSVIGKNLSKLVPLMKDGMKFTNDQKKLLHKLRKLLKTTPHSSRKVYLPKIDFNSVTRITIGTIYMNKKMYILKMLQGYQLMTAFSMLA